ncbi:conserved protein of unknown function [Candidatus Nitrosocosmicus franklandus]|uniref:Uncharacterized protein n=1 Tax=Candidatus Nitrosocosmicus franklandianus TaxID=1798806 RepID=A0A484IBA7_9ARCH|nr:conserved protein of unknown function [Candidatus Nitrosocosmicus franklandus]
MADSFDNMIFSSSLIIFILALIFIFAYDLLFARGRANRIENIHETRKLGRKASKAKNKQQFDKVE